jgi:hypothetical protein
MMLVSLAQAKANLLIDIDTWDADLTLKIKGASNMVARYIKRRSRLYISQEDSNGTVILDSDGRPIYEYDSNGQRLVREEVQAAVLVMTGMLFRDRDATTTKDWELGYLPKAVTSLVYHLRDPAYA